MRLAYDAVTPANIPADAQIVLGYVDGKYAWSNADWARFTVAIKGRIAVFASTNDGQILDVERYDATPAQAPGWVKMRRAAGIDPTVYCALSTWDAVKAAFVSAGVAEPHYWIAAYPGNGAALYPGSVAHQYQSTNVDLSVVADYWPGIDPKPSPTPVLKETDMFIAEQDTNAAWLIGVGAKVRIFDPNDLHVYQKVCPSAGVVSTSFLNNIDTYVNLTNLINAQKSILLAAITTAAGNGGSPDQIAAAVVADLATKLGQ